MNLELISRFAEAAMLNEKHDPWARPRKQGVSYAWVLIASCKYPDWWYAPFVGLEFFAELKLEDQSRWNKGLVLVGAKAVRLVNSRVHTGRDVDGQDVIII